MIKLILTLLIMLPIYSSASSFKSVFHIDNSASYLSNILVANKSEGKLWFLNNKKEVEMVVPMASGLKEGDKAKEGDLRTPEGLYAFTRPLSKDFLIKNYPKDYSLYGFGAIASNYPNPVDLFENKTGSGIWLHGTDNEDRISKKLDSKGCFVINNSTIEELTSRLDLNSTLLISISNKENSLITESDVTDIKTKISEWASLWKHKDPAFFELYHPKFKSGKNKNKEKFLNNKKKQFVSSNIKKVEASDFFIFKKDNFYYVSFFQEYNSNKVKDTGIKEIWLEKTDNAYSIIYESWKPFNKKDAL